MLGFFEVELGSVEYSWIMKSSSKKVQLIRLDRIDWYPRPNLSIEKFTKSWRESNGNKHNFNKVR